MFEASVLIVAHPDDDILWFSSIIDKVDSIIFCFNDDPQYPKIGAARKKTIEEYPLSNVSTLDIAETHSLDKADWNQPIVNEYGVKLEKCQESDRSYKDTYDQLIKVVRSRVASRKNIFTHNPWGEYGHESHVLVYRVLKALQAEFNYDIWFSNYCSNRSVTLMNDYISGFSTDYECFPVNRELAQEICKLYQQNECWTWFEDYQWVEQECLIREKSFIDPSDLMPYGHSFPVNFIKWNVERKNIKPYYLAEVLTRFKRKLKRFIN